MKINVSSILKDESSFIDVKFKQDSSVLDENRLDFKLNSDVEFSGKLENVSGILKLTGILTTSYLTNCSRCLKEFENGLRIVVDEQIFSIDDELADGEYFYESNLLEVDKILVDNILLNLPVKSVCSQECKGLCPICGVNLNNESCDCVEDSIDPRLQELKKYFKE